MAIPGAGKFGGTGWSHNYPTSELHLNQLISEATIINIQPASYRIVQLESPEIFKYPFAYVSEPGEMWLHGPGVYEPAPSMWTAGDSC